MERLLCPWDSPGKNTGVGSHFLLQGIFQIQGPNLHLLNWQADSLPSELPLCITYSLCRIVKLERWVTLSYRPWDARDFIWDRAMETDQNTVVVHRIPLSTMQILYRRRYNWLHRGKDRQIWLPREVLDEPEFERKLRELKIRQMGQQRHSRLRKYQRGLKQPCLSQTF